MTIIELLSTCSKASALMRKHDILLALIFRAGYVICSASCRRGDRADEVSCAFTEQELVFLSKSAFAASLTALESTLLEKAECPLQS